MKFPPRLIIASPTPDLPAHLTSRGYPLIHASANLPSPSETLAKAIAIARSLDPQSSLPLSLNSKLEENRPFSPNKSTLFPKHLPAFIARACAELTAVSLILHGHDRIRQGPHTIVLAGFALAANPDSSLDTLTPLSPLNPSGGGTILAFVAIQPDSGSGESFDETIPNLPSPLWPTIDPRLDEMLDHWSIQPVKLTKSKP
jgi:hypothetical protein